MKIYTTSYCNKGHRLSDGVPVKHECYVLPVGMLLAEIDDNFELVNELLEQAKPLKRHIGSKTLGAI